VLAELTRAAQGDGLEVMLEVVSTSAEDELRSLRAAAEIGVDWVLGGTHAAEGTAILRGSGIKYCPFPGRVIGHPSELDGELEEIAEQSRSLTGLEGVHGLDLLAYRHRRIDPVALTRAVVEAAAGPVIVAGTIASLAQIRDVAAAGAWGFTIGGAIFEDRLPGGPGVPGQLREVLACSSAPTASNQA
jgi:DhnA family fructose-bisphosphate aldolase class Ia